MTDTFEINDTTLRAAVDQLGHDPDDVDRLLWHGAIGMVISAWRNGPIEDLHAGRTPLHDEHMMKINAQLTRALHERLLPLAILDIEQMQSGEYQALFVAALDGFDDWLFAEGTTLANGQTVTQLARTKVARRELSRAAGDNLRNIKSIAREHGIAAALWMASVTATLYGHHWWGYRDWPAIVDAFTATHGDEAPISADHLRTFLLAGPDRLTDELADWCISQGIGMTTVPR